MMIVRPPCHFMMIYVRVATYPQTEMSMTTFECQALWADDEVPHFRKHLTARITQLSQAWNTFAEENTSVISIQSTSG
jgi:hypothetical protein